MARRRLSSVSQAVGATLLVAAVGTVNAAAQTDPRLTAVVRLAQDGRADSARAVIRRLLEATAPEDSTYAEMLYTSGLVAGTDHERRIALRRVIVEYSRSAWADDAILLLAQIEYGNGNPDATVSQVQRLISDYPTSPLLAVAAFWGARAASDARNGEVACQLADAGLAAGTEDVELKNQLDYQKQRCGAITAHRADSVRSAQTRAADSTKPPAPPAPAPPPPPPPPAAGRGAFRVQIIAAPNQGKADQAVASLNRIGYAAVIRREGGFLKVRAGPFQTRAEAQAALTKIRARLGGRPFIVVDQ